MISVPTLSVGDVPLVVRPVADRAALVGLVDVLRGITGVAGVSVGPRQGVEARLTVHLDRPVALAGELRSALYHSLESCSLVAGRLVVVLNTAAAAPMATPPVGATPTAEDDPRRATLAPAEELPVLVDPDATAAAARAIDGLGDLSILTFDLEQRFLASAGGIHERFGHRFEDMRGRTARDVVLPESWIRLGPGYSGAVRGETVTIDFAGLDGTRTYEATFSPLLDGAAVVGGMVITRDVTDVRRGVRLLAELTAVLEVTFDRSPIGQALLSPTGRWLRVNETLQRLLEADEPSLVARTVQDLTHPDDLAAESVLLADLVAGHRRSYALSKRFLHADGREIPVVVVTSALLGTDGTLDALISQVSPAVA